MSGLTPQHSWQLGQARQNHIGMGRQIGVSAGAAEDADLEAGAGTAAHFKVVHGVADDGNFAWLQAGRLGERDGHAGCGLGAMSTIAAHEKREPLDEPGVPAE